MVYKREDVVGTIDTDEFFFTLTIYDNVFFCHLDVKKWNKEAYKTMLVRFAEIREKIPHSLHANISKDNKRAQKLAKMFGFIPLFKTKETIIMRSVWEMQ